LRCRRDGTRRRRRRRRLGAHRRHLGANAVERLEDLLLLALLDALKREHLLHAALERVDLALDVDHELAHLLEMLLHLMRRERLEGEGCGGEPSARTRTRTQRMNWSCCVVAACELPPAAGAVVVAVGEVVAATVAAPEVPMFEGVVAVAAVLAEAAAAAAGDVAPKGLRLLRPNEERSNCPTDCGGCCW